MKIDKKRKVIEVLLCSVGIDVRYTTWDTCRKIGYDDRGPVAMMTNQLWYRCRGRNDFTTPHGDVCLEAAYRLIESSPTLRREWFGAR